MSINDTFSPTAAANPAVSAVASSAGVKNAILAGMQTGDTAVAGLLGALSTQSQETSKLLSSLSGLGQHVDLHA